MRYHIQIGDFVGIVDGGFGHDSGSGLVDHLAFPGDHDVEVHFRFVAALVLEGGDIVDFGAGRQRQECCQGV